MRALPAGRHFFQKSLYKSENMYYNRDTGISALRGFRKTLKKSGCEIIQIRRKKASAERGRCRTGRYGGRIPAGRPQQGQIAGKYGPADDMKKRMEFTCIKEKAKFSLQAFWLLQ